MIDIIKVIYKQQTTNKEQIVNNKIIILHGKNNINNKEASENKQ